MACSLRWKVMVRVSPELTLAAKNDVSNRKEESSKAQGKQEVPEGPRVIDANGQLRAGQILKNNHMRTRNTRTQRTERTNLEALAQQGDDLRLVLIHQNEIGVWALQHEEVVLHGRDGDLEQRG
jgi:hypothetical protein